MPTGRPARLTRVVAVIGRARAAAAAAAAAASRGTASAAAASGVRPRPIASRGGARNHLVVSSSASSSATTTMGGAAKEKKPPPPPSTVGDIEDLASKHPGLTSARERAPRMRASLLEWYDANHRVLPWRRNARSTHAPPPDPPSEESLASTGSALERARAHWRGVAETGASAGVPPEQYAYGVWVRRVLLLFYTGPHTTPFALWTPFLKDFARRSSPSLSSNETSMSSNN
jgi:A/G-specific adenine glycosylase